MSNKPYSEAAHQNREAILAVLRQEFERCAHILEIGSGSGQHAVFFPKHLQHLSWQPSDKAEYLAGIQLWIDECNPPKPNKPLALDVCKTWPAQKYDGMFAANVAHIMHWHEIQAMFAGVGKQLNDGGVFCLYGPFNKNGEYTSASNQSFDVWLKQRDPQSCIRDKADLDKLAAENKLTPGREWEMPANNFILTWRKT
jgi:cyclopropane fatty-acyl-phospholipid synthase-like methyltransferase